MNNQAYNYLYSEPSQSSDTSLFGSYGKLNTHSVINNQSEQKLFAHHELTPKNNSYITREHTNNDLIFSFLILDLIIVIISLSIYRKQLSNTILALFSSKDYQQIESKSLVKHPLTTILFFGFILNMASFIYLIIENNILEISIPVDSNLLFYIIASLLSFYLIKLLFIFISSVIFNVLPHGKTYINYILLWTMNIGIFLSFFLWLMVYAYHWVLIPIFLTFYILLSSFRVIQTSLRILPKTDFNSFHFFLYLCTVEILPLIVLGKIVISGF